MSQTRKGDHVFNIFHEILEIFQFIFVLTIPARWLKVGVTANPEKNFENGLLLLLEEFQIVLTSRTRHAIKIFALVSSPIMNQIRYFT